jgi:hypothetical protein
LWIHKLSASAKGEPNEFGGLIEFAVEIIMII